MKNKIVIEIIEERIRKLKLVREDLAASEFSKEAQINFVNKTLNINRIILNYLDRENNLRN